MNCRPCFETRLSVQLPILGYHTLHTDVTKVGISFIIRSIEIFRTLAEFENKVHFPSVTQIYWTKPYVTSIRFGWNRCIVFDVIMNIRYSAWFNVLIGFALIMHINQIQERTVHLVSRIFRALFHCEFTLIAYSTCQTPYFPKSLTVCLMLSFKTKILIKKASNCLTSTSTSNRKGSSFSLSNFIGRWIEKIFTIKDLMSYRVYENLAKRYQCS